MNIKPTLKEILNLHIDGPSIVKNNSLDARTDWITLETAIKQNPTIMNEYIRLRHAPTIPVSDIPAVLFGIFLQHSRGAV